MAFVATSSQKVSEPKALFYDQIVNLKPADFFFAASNFSTTLSFHFPTKRKSLPFLNSISTQFQILPSNPSPNQLTQITPLLNVSINLIWKRGPVTLKTRWVLILGEHDVLGDCSEVF